MNEPTAWERMLNKAERERDDLRAEVERHRLAVHDALMACMDLEWATDGSERSMVNQVREVVRRWRADKAERDALQRQATRVRRHVESRAVTSRARGRADEEREWLDVLALLDAVEPADQPHPTPEADEACTLPGVCYGSDSYFVDGGGR